MASTAIEVESKFDVEPDSVVPFLGVLPGVARVDPVVVHELVATYVDTQQLDLLAAGITVRRRSGGDDAGWHLKVPWHGARYELREPETQTSVPDSLRAVVRGLTRDRALGEVATVRTTRTILHLCDERDAVVAEFCDDRVSAERSPGLRCPAMTWREWELELSRPNEVLAAAGAQLLRAAGASPSAHTSKLARALHRSSAGDRPVGSCGPGATVAEVLQVHLRTQVSNLRLLDPAVRADLPDALHQMRVTARRLRSVLAAYRPELDVSVTEPLRAELGWLISGLGRARDLEVLRERIRCSSADHEPIAALLGEDTCHQLAESHRDAVATMASPRYFRLVDDLDALVREPPWSERAAGTADAEFVRCLRRQWRRMQKAADRARVGHSRDRGRRLHDVRRAAKRLRYAAEVAHPVLGSRADALAGALEGIQDVLGHHHDALLAGQFVREATGRDRGRGLLREAHVVRRRLAEEAAVDDETFERLYRRLSRSADTRWLR